MTNATYKKIDVVGTSTESVDAAIKSGISKAAETVKNLDWFEVSEIRGHIENGEVAHFQVAMKIGFRLD
ncbi:MULTISPECIES: dodecin [Alphaproteobacteria]|uniref:dodecin n=1 Tax=Alphaproteobacteria TaxID=28211 RepID=UPI0012BCF4CC|nr:MULTISPECIES: dodecin [Alphaproteobacteria]MTI01891.1 dodecin domain-containing protein [Roseibium sp. RKSG952]